MTRIFIALTTALVVLLTRSPTGQTPQAELSAANLAWEAGDYVTALETYLRLLRGPAAAAVLEPIALQTGELFQTEEITTDGVAPRFSRDGHVIVYEVGTGLRARTRLVRTADGRALVAELPGRGAEVAPGGDRVAYLRVAPTDEVREAERALEALAPDAPQRGAARQRLSWLLLKSSDIVVRDLASGREVVLRRDGLLVASLAWSADGHAVYCMGAREGEPDRSDIYTASESAPPVRLTDADGVKVSPLVDPTGQVLVYTVVAATSPANPFRPPQTPGGGPAGGAGRGQPPPQAPAGQAGGQPAEGVAARAPSAPPQFGIVHLAARRTTVMTGISPALSADGSTLAYVVPGRENTLSVMPVGGAPVAVKTTPARLASPAVSPDGRRLAFQIMPREDWEIFVVDRDGRNEMRVTREIQHDVLPQFLTDTLLLAAVGEPRHRRSYLYDLNTLTRRRLFHNNTVRTVAPEYAWVATRDGTKLLVSAERDGDTVSPARGIYLVHLDRRVRREDVLARVEANLASEKTLRVRAQRLFAPIADEVRRVVSQVSVPHVYSYEKALFDFDSKHISRPGNRKAIDYLVQTYASFGYAPELQWFEARGALGGETANVLATLKGTENPDLMYAVSSHFDSTAAGPGADDDSSGTAALLETARVLARHPLPATVVFASFTGEEAGLLGSREFVRQAVEKRWRIVGALNNDTVGWANDHRLDNTIRYSNPGIRDVQHAAALGFTRLITYDALYYKGTDAAAYYDAWGDIVGGIGSYPILGSPHYHQPHDVLETINHELVAEVAKTTVATIMLLASSPSRVQKLTVANGNDGVVEVTWDRSPERSVQEYIVAVGPNRDSLEERLRVREPRARLARVPPGWVVAVKAVNARGLEGWDWAWARVATKE